MQIPEISGEQFGLPNCLSGKESTCHQEMQEACIRFLDGEDPLEKEMATHFSIPAWRIPWTEEVRSMRPQRVRHD